MNLTQQPATPAADRDQLDLVEVDPVEALTPGEVLTGAAVYVERHGLHQGDMFARSRKYFPRACMLGAIRMAACGGRTIALTPASAAVVDDTIGVLADYLRGLDFSERHGDPSQCVADWNDTPDRTPAHAAAALRAAARQWEHTFGGVQ